ncbi:hypothetical protein [Chloroflexus sp.]|uniref:hypothetical protein n=1 Tax=Chloroflexus sp. TaxID=1904827 RepID=UPI00298EECA7|nr:hypothetical protein [Chloroflexus sp.]MCS6887682.1 hypothetical protein [Chloroflexus sp.]MDW8404283.1 hypothetical protein [Chloroflexus sp.]
MPMLEVFYSGDHPPSREQKRAFAAAASAILQRVIGTPPGRLQLVVRVLEREDTLAVLAEEEETKQDRE